MAKQQKDDKNIVIHDLTLVSTDRSRKDVGSLKNAIEAAEFIHYPNRVMLYDIYQDILSLDGHLSGIVEKRINTALNKKVRFKRADGEYDGDLATLLNGQKGRGVRKLILESILWGVSGLEFKIGPSLDFEEIPRKHIKPEKGIITKSQYSISEQDAFRYDELPFVWVIGEKKDMGRLLACVLYGIYKRGALGDYAQFIEIFGQPVRIIYYDAHDTATKAELRKTLDEAGSSLALMIPKQAEFQMMDGKTSNGDGKLQESFIKNVCNSEMSIAILGNTETTSASASSGYAQSKEHADQQDELIASDLILLEGYLNSGKFLEVLRSYGYNVEGGAFEHELDINLAKLKERLAIDFQLKEVVPIDDDYWYNTYHLPKPPNYAKLKSEMEARRQAMAQIQPADGNEKPAKGDDKPQRKLSDHGRNDLLDGFMQFLADFFDRARH